MCGWVYTKGGAMLPLLKTKGLAWSLTAFRVRFRRGAFGIGQVLREGGGRDSPRRPASFAPRWDANAYAYFTGIHDRARKSM
jgi:hypothetical protein